MTFISRLGRGALAAAALASIITGTSAFAETAKQAPTEPSCELFAPEEVAFRFSYGIGEEDSLRYYTFGPRVAYDLPYVPAIFDNRVRIAIELMGAIINGDHHDLDGEFAFTPLLFDYRYDRGGTFVPFFEGGEGIVLTTIEGARIGGPFEFSSQVGGGLHLFYTTEDALTLGMRYRHISNAGIKEENSGLNTFYITIGLSHFPDRR